MTSGKTKSKRKKWSAGAIAAVVVISLLLVFGLVYDFFLKDQVVKLSEAKLSEMLKMNVSFDSYQFVDGSSLEIRGLHIESPYLKEDYREVNAHHTDWISARIGYIKLADFSYERLFNHDECSASLVMVDSVYIDVYRDKTLPNPPFKLKKMPASVLQSLAGPVNVDTILLSHINIVYEERTKHAAHPGRISFNNLSAECFNLTNDSARLAENPIFTITARADVQDEAHITADIRFDLASERDEFHLSAASEPFDAQILNPVITGVLPAKITGGSVEDLQLDMSATYERATGTLIFEYSGMQFKLLDDAGDAQSWLATLAAKSVIRNENLRSENNFREGEVDFSRRKDRFIFNYWWNSLKSGMVDVMVSDAGKLMNLDEKARETN